MRGNCTNIYIYCFQNMGIQGFGSNSGNSCLHMSECMFIQKCFPLFSGAHSIKKMHIGVYRIQLTWTVHLTFCWTCTFLISICHDYVFPSPLITIPSPTPTSILESEVCSLEFEEFLLNLASYSLLNLILV